MIAARRLSNLSGLLLLLGIVAATVTTPTAQISGPTGLVATRSVNMVSGTSWPTGDPFLQRQNEPSVGVSTRNPQHLVAGANDYRSVDLPGISTGPETGDAWLGLYKSFDGGERWQSTLLPGYPQDTTPEGLASPLHAYQAGADAVVRPGTNGLMYFSGLVFNRGANAPSAVFVSRLIDNNNKENGDPIAYLGATIVDKSTGADFIDKPWMAVDVPRQGAKSCKVTQTDLPPAVKPLKNPEKFHNAKKPKKDPPKLKDPKPYTQSIPAGMIYLAYSRITTVGTDITARIMFTSSDDCGQTWAKPIQISDPADKVNQGATIAIDPTTGAVTVAWRQFGLTTTSTDSIVAARSLMKGKFNSPEKVHKFLAHRPNDKLKKMIVEHQMGEADDVAEIAPFDQGTAEDRFRTNAYPSIAIDDESRAYLAWTERGFGVARSSTTEGDARVVIATSKFGGAWTAPRAVDVGTNATDMPGHQLMPSVAFAAGKLVVVYYDLREDVSQVFGPFVAEQGLAVTVHKRHTIDIRSAYAAKGDVPVFGPSIRVSQYLMGSRPGSTELEQMQYNAPNLPLFKLGTVPFMGDYIDLAPSPAFVQENGAWRFNTKAQVAPVFHVVWTDNRDVRPPRDGDWTHYTPVKVAGVPGTFDPNQPAPACVPGQTGMRNQNIYSARLTFGLVTGSPGNAKPIDATVPRGFVVFAQNTTTGVKSYRMTIASQPVGGKASFTQTALAGHPDPLVSVDVSIPAKSMISRTVFITSSDPHAQVAVDVAEISAPAQPIVAGGLSSRVLLNPDISNPDISNPDISNPDISNPDISNAEVYNPDISNPDISNPDISNPDISNPDISNPDISNVVVANPDISNPDISNPDISNPDISNPDISNPDISNPDISNGALTDVTWTIVNTGNTTTSFNVNLFLANAAAKLAGVKTQLIVHKTYSTPIADECTLKSQTQTVLVANVPNPTFQAPGTSTPFDPSNPSVQNTTVWLEPGGTSKITLRIVDPNPQDGIKIDPVRDVTPVVTADPPVNTADIGTTNPQPPAAAPPTAPDVHLNFALTGEPTNTILTLPISPVQAHAEVNGGPAAGVQVTVAIANNPAGGHLSGTTTLLTDANGNATFADLSIEKVGAGYQLSASASASGALPDVSAPFDITFAPTVANVAGGTFTYDGQPHAGSCTVTGFDNVPLTGAISYSSVNAPVDAGNYTVTCTYSGNGFYGPASNSAPIVIAPAPSSTTVTCSDATYTGSAQETCTATVSGAGGLSTDAPVTYSNNVNAGTATGSASYAGDANHSGSNGSANFTIAPAASQTTLACSDVTYTGAPQQPCTSSVTGAGGLVNTAPITYSNNVAAGTGSANAVYAGDANHTGSNASNTFTISPATPTADAVGGNFTFDGAAHPGTCAVTGVPGEILSGAISWSSGLPPVNPGTYIITCAFPAGSNYTGASDTDTIVITDPYLVTKTVDDGSIGTLRFAINQANANADVNVIRFAIPSAPYTITPSSPLPVITQPVVIDGLTQAGSATYAPVVTISGAAAGAGAAGLQISASGATVRGLAIQNFSAAGVLVFSGANSTTVEDNVIRSNNAGVNIVGSNANFVRRNVLSANTFSGLIVSGGTGTTASNNRIGTTADGTAAQGNLDNGVTLFGGVTNTLIDSNLISGNTHAGIDAQFGPAGTKVTGLRVINNTIGLALDGDTAVPNRTGGIRLNQTEGAIIGEPGGRNIISGNATFDPLTCAAPVGGPGILVFNASAVMPVIKNNFIGLSADGLKARPNGYEGIHLDAKAQVGGSGANDGNRIAGNGCAPALAGTGINIGPSGSGSIVQGNKIGLSAAGAALGNGYSGISAFATAGATIGGPNAGEENVITGNGIGIAIYKSGANPSPSGITIVRNQIGADVSGDLPGNTGVGVSVADAIGIVIGGGPGDANLIRGNGSHGVQIQGTSNVSVLSNSIDGNGGLGIDLVGPAANGNQAAPVLSHAVDNGNSTTVDFSLASDDPNTMHKVQLFVSASCDASGRGEGSRLEGTFAETTDGSGNVSGTLTLDEQFGIGTIVTATVTDGQGNTSEFSNCTTVAAPLPPATINSASPANGKSGEGFIVLRGSNLPTDIATLQSGAGPANGFVFQSPSTANAVWVRLPGAPSGPATIQLKNAAGTVVSNAFPITITPDPGTPVITGIYSDTAQPITAPVPAGATVEVAADGIDTTGAVVRFVQGTNTWDVAVSSAASNTAIGVAGVVAVPMTVSTGTVSVSIRQGSSLLSAPVNLNVNAAPPPFTAWAASGPGTVNTTNNGAVDGRPQFNYNLTLGGGGVPLNSWQFTTTSPTSRNVQLAWTWNGFHAFFQVTARLDVFIRRGGSDIIVSTPVNFGPVNCCSAPSGGFSYSGTLALNVLAGDIYGFKLSGSNGDSNSTLQGTLSVVVDGGATPEPAAVELLAAETGFGLLDERSDVVEHVERGAIVEEQRRRFTAPR